ncbi:ASI1-immunoprecipitated protein 2-like [Bidens hawaiensis]|uniref:ASI1-immunoprecipitated protein 2-like n=1 Tax=Bidens hawaiensis TaxID=980011 RepID=UPI00404B8E37
MKKANASSDKPNGVKTLVKSKTREYKQQATSETSNSESTSSSYNAKSEKAESKVKKKASHIKKVNDGANMSDDADNANRLRNIEEKSSLRSDGCENNNKVNVDKQKEKVGPNDDGDNMHEEHLKEEETSQSHHTDGSDESDVVEHDVKVCDICGDAGREDLLAVCSKCLDGAEHTYCMKVMIDKVPEGDWLCEECELEETKIKNQHKNRKDVEKDQSSDSAAVKVSGKRRAEELESSSSFKKQALEITGPTKDVDRGKVKSSHQFSSDSRFDNESAEGSRSLVKRPQLQSLRGGFSKSSSFSFPNAKSKTKLVDEVVLQRQKSTKERASHDSIAGKEMSKSMSFRSTNLGRFGPNGSKVKMLSPNSAHVQDHSNLINKKERTFERTNSVKLNTSNSALTPKGDRLSSSRGETNSGSVGPNSEVKLSKGDGKITSGLKPKDRSVSLGAEASVSQGHVDKQLPSSPTKVGNASSSGNINSVEHKATENSSKVTSKEPTNLADGIKENTMGTSGVFYQNNKQTGQVLQGSSGNNASAVKISKDVKNGENKLKDAIEAALLKKPGIYRKSKVADQPDESSVPTVNNDAAIVDRVPHSRSAVSLTSAEVPSTDWHGQISRTYSVDHLKQSNGNSHKPLTTGLSNHDDVALSSLLKNSAIPDHECIWQGGFEINRSGRAAEFWDGLQAHLSMCASPRVVEAVNSFPHKILLNGVSRLSAWPTQFENSGVKEENIAIYFFAKDLESYEKSYLVLLDDMIKGDLALIGSINGVELLIFPSNQLPEKSNRWNMLFYLWGVFRGKKKKPSNRISNNPEKGCVPQPISSIPTDKVSIAENASLTESIEKDKHVDSESKVNSKSQDSSHEKAVDSVSVVPASKKEMISETHVQNEPKKHPFIDLSDDVDLNGTSQIPNNPGESCAPQPVPLVLTDKMPLAENASLIGSVEKDKHVDPEAKVNSKLQNASHEKAVDSVSVVPASSKEVISEIHVQNEPKKCPFIDLSDDVDLNGTSQTNTWHDVSGRTVKEEGNSNKKLKSDLYGQNSNLDIEKADAGNKSNGERYFFPVEKKTPKKPVFELDLNEDITCLVEEENDDDMIVEKKNDNDDVASSLSLSLAFSPLDKAADEDKRANGKWQSGTSRYGR